MAFIGLTGGLGTGKTTVLKFFKKLGAYTLDADKLVHEILKRPAIMKRLSVMLGKEILKKKGSTVSINKKRMADVIFSNPQKRKSAEKVIHPDVIKTVKNIKKKITTKNPDTIIVFEIPLLFEAGYEKIFDKIIVVHCKKVTAIKRLKRRGLSKEEAIMRMQVQMPIRKKKASADFLINNNSTIEDLRARVKAILKELSK